MVSPEGIDNGKARPQADAVLLMTSGINRSERNARNGEPGLRQLEPAGRVAAVFGQAETGVMT